MYSQPLKKYSDFLKVILNLSPKTEEEVKRLYGSNYTYALVQELFDTEMHVIKLVENNEPVGVYGVKELKKNSAGIFLLTTDKLHNGNMIKFLREAKKQIILWEQQYDLLMDNCYKRNKTIIKWLTLLGFKPSIYEDNYFQIYYKGNINEY